MMGNMGVRIEEDILGCWVDSQLEPEGKVDT